MTVNLRVPGPTPSPAMVLEASGQQMINHRGPEFRDLIFRLTDNLKTLFATTNDLYILTASGTGAMETAVVNTMSPGDRVLAISVGVFGDRFTTIARTYGADVVEMKVEHGKVVDPDDVRKNLRDDPTIKTVIITHNETSTGVTNDIGSVAQVVKGEFNKLFLVDAISSIGSIPCPVDAWDLDIVTSGSQKGWMAPPGLAFVSVSSRAWEAYEEAKCPRFYFDLAAAQRYLERGQTPWTPAISVYYAMDTATKMLLEEGVENVFERHDRVARMCREGIKNLGLKLFAEESVASSTVTAVHVPDGVNGAELATLMRTEHNVVLAGGQASLEGKIFRIGHLGYCSEDDIQNVLDSLQVVLPQVGFKG